MATTNKVTVTRNMINRAVRELTDQLNFETGTAECDLGKSCSVFVDIECHDNGWFREMEIIAVDLIKDGVDSNVPYPNIADYISKRLNAEVAKLNANEYQSEYDYAYQKEYENGCVYL